MIGYHLDEESLSVCLFPFKFSALWYDSILLITFTIVSFSITITLNIDDNTAF